MQATVIRYRRPAVRHRPHPHLAGARATLVAFGAALLAMFGINEY